MLFLSGRVSPQPPSLVLPRCQAVELDLRLLSSLAWYINIMLIIIIIIIITIIIAIIIIIKIIAQEGTSQTYHLVRPDHLRTSIEASMPRSHKYVILISTSIMMRITMALCDYHLNDDDSDDNLLKVHPGDLLNPTAVDEGHRPEVCG